MFGSDCKHLPGGERNHGRLVAPHVWRNLQVERRLIRVGAGEAWTYATLPATSVGKKKKKKGKDT
ncbi:hypothetical protein BHE74_00027830 [Ensete ventricosum]|nr:hypothetical protein BHE74_00027830 [Ensete ventricosum]